MLKKKLINFGKEKNDIKKIYISKNDYSQITFILIVDDVTNDTTLDYIDYSYDLKEEFKEVVNFMLLDLSEESSLKYMFDNLKIIYRKILAPIF